MLRPFATVCSEESLILPAMIFRSLYDVLCSSSRCSIIGFG